ncbi:MAG: DUF5050 domain-containing protein [Lachnospiraceae bacterium]|nr:DUF5050 domain-containing protein [Lachnospiraceae bacterium]
MKKGLVLFFTAVMMVCMLAGCGKDKGSSDKTQTTTEEAKAGLEKGYWVADKMVMEGTEFSGQDMVDIFGAKENIMSLVFSDGKVDGVIFDDYISTTYTGTIDDFTIAMDGETLKGKGTGKDTIELTLQDGSSFTLVNQDEMPAPIANNPWKTYNIDFSAEDSCDMSNFNVQGRYYVADGFVYGLSHSVSLDGTFAATPFEMKGDFPEFGEPISLDDRGLAYYINQYEDYLYYILDFTEICRVHTDGTGRETLYSGDCDYLQIHEGKLYFTDGNFHFVSADLDGANVTKVVEKEVYYPYFIATDWIIFQDDADGESLHLYNVGLKTELNITYEPSFNPIISGKYLYYLSNAEEGYLLNQIDMSDPDMFACDMANGTIADYLYLIDGEEIYTINNNHVALSDWKSLTEPGDEYACVDLYTSKDFRIYHDINEQGLITGKYLSNKNTSGGTSFE